MYNVDKKISFPQMHLKYSIENKTYSQNVNIVHNLLWINVDNLCVF